MFQLLFFTEGDESKLQVNASRLWPYFHSFLQVLFLFLPDCSISPFQGPLIPLPNNRHSYASSALCAPPAKSASQYLRQPSDDLIMSQQLSHCLCWIVFCCCLKKRQFHLWAVYNFPREMSGPWACFWNSLRETKCSSRVELVEMVQKELVEIIKEKKISFIVSSFHKIKPHAIFLSSLWQFTKFYLCAYF